jgi:hypothetical protein
MQQNLRPDTQVQQKADSPQQRPGAQNIDQTGPKNPPGQQGGSPSADQIGGSRSQLQNQNLPADQPIAQKPPNPFDQNQIRQNADQSQFRQAADLKQQGPPLTSDSKPQGPPLAGDQSSRAAADAAARAIQNQQSNDRGLDKAINPPSGIPIDKVQPPPGQQVFGDGGKGATPGSDKTAGSGAGAGADRVVGSMGGAPVGDKSGAGASGGQQVPGTDVRVVPLTSASTDARVQGILQNNVDKQAGIAGKDAVAAEQKPAAQMAAELASKATELTTKGQVTADQTARLADTSGKVRQAAIDGALQQTEAAARAESAVKGAVSQAGDAATLAAGTTDSSALVQAQRNGIPGLDLKNPTNLQFVNDAMKQLQGSNIKEFNPQTQSIKDLLPGLDPTKADKLQTLFQQGADATKGGVITRDGMMQQLGLILTANRENPLAAGQTKGTDRLGALLSGQQSALTGSSFLSELIKALDGANHQIGVESGQNVIGINALTARTLGQQEQHATTSEAFTAQLTPAQADLIKMLLAIKQDGKPETTTGAKIETGATGVGDAKAGRVTDAAAALAGVKGKEDQQQQGKPGEDKDKEKDKELLDREKEEQDKKKKKEKDDEDDITSPDRRKAALAALLAIQKLKEEKEKALKEKDKLAEKDKKKDEEGKRTQYTVRERDTLQSIALKQLRDVRLAPLIYEINKTVIPIVRQRGRDSFVLKAGQIIWLPSVLESSEFRAKLAGAAMNPPPQQPLTPLQQAVAAENAMTPEQELATKFGTNWDGAQGDTASGATNNEAENALMTEAIDAARTRRENIERVLGPIDGKKEPVSERIRYVARLGDTLKSIALKHPALEDESMWTLVAQINNLSRDTDETGAPTAKLSRGTVLQLPSPSEVETYKKLHGPREAKCPACGASMENSATICSACHPPEHSSTSDPSTNDTDAGMIVMQAAGFVKPGDVPVDDDEPGP